MTEEVVKLQNTIEILKQTIESLTKERDSFLLLKEKCCLIEIEEVLKRYDMKVMPVPNVQLVRKS